MKGYYKMKTLYWVGLLNNFEYFYSKDGFESLNDAKDWAYYSGGNYYQVFITEYVDKFNESEIVENYIVINGEPIISLI